MDPDLNLLTRNCVRKSHAYLRNDHGRYRYYFTDKLTSLSDSSSLIILFFRTGLGLRVFSRSFPLPLCFFTGFFSTTSMSLSLVFRFFLIGTAGRSDDSLSQLESDTSISSGPKLGEPLRRLAAAAAV